MIMRFRRLASLGPSEIAMLRDAFLELVHVRTALWLLPWGRLTTPSLGTTSTSLLSPGADRLEWAIRAASRFIPRATCLTQAIALHRLLSIHGYQSVVQVGARNDEGRFGAHAWVEHEGRPLLSTTSDIARYSRFFTWPHSRLDLP